MSDIAMLASICGQHHSPYCQSCRASHDSNSARIVSLESKLAEAERALEQGAVWFEEYAIEHYKKALTAPDGREQHAREAKGKTNRARSEYLLTTLATIREEEPLPAKQGEE